MCKCYTRLQNAYGMPASLREEFRGGGHHGGHGGHGHGGGGHHGHRHHGGHSRWGPRSYYPYYYNPYTYSYPTYSYPTYADVDPNQSYGGKKYCQCNTSSSTQCVEQNKCSNCVKNNDSGLDQVYSSSTCK